MKKTKKINNKETNCKKCIYYEHYEKDIMKCYKHKLLYIGHTGYCKDFEKI